LAGIFAVADRFESANAFAGMISSFYGYDEGACTCNRSGLASLRFPIANNIVCEGTTRCNEQSCRREAYLTKHAIPPMMLLRARERYRDQFSRAQSSRIEIAAKAGAAG